MWPRRARARRAGPLNRPPARADTEAMDTERLLAESERGIHLLFDTGTIAEAFAQDPRRLELALLREGPAVQDVVDALWRQPSAAAGRRFVAALPAALRHLLVVLYFELLDGRLLPGRVLH